MVGELFQAIIEVSSEPPPLTLRERLNPFRKPPSIEEIPWPSHFLVTNNACYRLSLSTIERAPSPPSGRSVDAPVGAKGQAIIKATTDGERLVLHLANGHRIVMGLSPFATDEGPLSWPQVEFETGPAKSDDDDEPVAVS